MTYQEIITFIHDKYNYKSSLISIKHTAASRQAKYFWTTYGQYHIHYESLYNIMLGDAIGVKVGRR